MRAPVRKSLSGTMTGTTESGVSGRLPSIAQSYRRFWIILLVILGSDQLSKWVIVEYSGFTRGLYPPFGGIELVPGFFNLVYAVNYGAAWGILEGFSWLLVGMAVLVLTLVAVFHRHLELHLAQQQWCFGLLTGGILGNTIDRLLRGHVVDFLDFHLRAYRWPTFNVADSAIVVGTFWYLFLQYRPNPRETG
jgi:signal peptidase II